ncbi:actin-like [Stegodyphus dumicola]|uniref:actin-like n=1 Tax=Stegodyphus dumicola TaxID=202533 RepID=UPI0015B0CA83|nr:actin-like [Stegodyphus dumicola]
MDVSEGLPTIVIDFGSSVAKAGFAGDDFPIFSMPSTIGIPKYPRCMPSLVHDREFYVGDEAQKHRGILSLHYPVERGIVKDWDSYEKVMDYILIEGLGIDCSHHPILYAEPALNPLSNGEMIAELMFEKFNALSFYLTLKPALALYASGSVTGSILYSGGGITTTMAVFEGCKIKQATNRVNFGGRDVTNYLIKLLSEKNYIFITPAEREIGREIKETLCFVSKDYELDLNMAAKHPATRTKDYILPDGQTLKLTKEMFQSPEILFTPSAAGREENGVQDLILSTVAKCDIDLRKNLYSNLIITGGNTMFPGFSDRLRKELRSKVNQKTPVCLIAPEERRFMVWLGGSILASLSACKKLFIAKSEYDAEGSKIIHKKCLL